MSGVAASASPSASRRARWNALFRWRTLHLCAPQQATPSGSCRRGRWCGRAPCAAGRSPATARSRSLPSHPCRPLSCRCGRHRWWCRPSGDFLSRILPPLVRGPPDTQAAVGQADAPWCSAFGAPFVEGPAADVQVCADLGDGELVAGAFGAAGGHAVLSVRWAGSRRRAWRLGAGTGRCSWVVVMARPPGLPAADLPSRTGRRPFLARWISARGAVCAGSGRAAPRSSR